MAKAAEITPAYRLIEPFAPTHRPNAEIPAGTIVHQAVEDTNLRGGRQGRFLSVSMDPKGMFPTFLIPMALLEPHDLPLPNIKPPAQDLALRTHKDFALEHGANLVHGLTRLFTTIQKIRAIKGVSAEEFSNDVRSVSSLTYAFQKRLNRALSLGIGPEQVPARSDDAEEHCYLIKKGGYWYRENRCGYTANKYDAGRYTKAEAEAEAAIEPWHMRAIHQDDVEDDSPAATLQEVRAENAWLRGERQALLDTDRWVADVRAIQAREHGAQLAWETLLVQFEALGDQFVPEERRTEFRQAIARLGEFDSAHLEVIKDLAAEDMTP